jgi:predicted Zn-dependent peptidase
VGRGPFVVSTSVQTGATDAAIREIFQEVRDVRGMRPPTIEELELARATLTRGFPRNFETASQIARAASQLALYGLPDDYFTRFVPDVNAVTTDQVVEAARTHLDPHRLLTVVVGDAARIRPGLERLELGPIVEVPTG